jgi:hypothetical protein
LQPLLGGPGTGFACLKTVIFPQFVVGNGWTSQLGGFMPAQSPATGLVTGTAPGFLVIFQSGSAVTATPNNSAPVLLSSASGGCLGLFDLTGGVTLQLGGVVIDSGAANRANYIGLATKGKCTGGSGVKIAGLSISLFTQVSTLPTPRFGVDFRARASPMKRMKNCIGTFAMALNSNPSRLCPIDFPVRYRCTCD